MSTHNLCFRAKIRKNVYPCTPQFHYIEVMCKGVYITRTCLHDETLFFTLTMLFFTFKKIIAGTSPYKRNPKLAPYIL